MIYAKLISLDKDQTDMIDTVTGCGFSAKVCNQNGFQEIVYCLHIEDFYYRRIMWVDTFFLFEKSITLVSI